MHMFQNLIDKLKAHPRKIVFTEGTDPRILEASARLLSGTFLTPVLVGRSRPPPRRPASISAAPSSLTRRTMTAWTPWWRRWWSCARAR